MVDELLLGTQVKSLFGFGTYCHHGIHLCNWVVLHRSKKAGGIMMQSMYDAGFSKKLTFVKNDNLESRQKVLIQAIKSYLVKPEGYNLIYRNCEHFASQENHIKYYSQL